MTQVLVRVHAAGLHRGDWHVIGNVTPVVGRSYPLREVPEAIRSMVEGRGGGGKIVITV